MQLNPNQTRSGRSLVKDEYEGGFLKQTAATEIRITADPADLVTINGDSITWAKPGTGTLRAEAVYPDGTVRPAEGVVQLVCNEPLPVPAPVTIQPGLVRAVLVDPDQ